MFDISGYNDIPCACQRCTTETGRKPGCHATCKKYKEYREKANLVLDKKREEAFRKEVAYVYVKSKRRRK